MISFAALAVSAAAIIAVNANNRMDEQFEANVEALADGEIFIGQICAYDKNVWCIYFDPYEEYLSRPIKVLEMRILKYFMPLIFLFVACGKSDDSILAGFNKVCQNTVYPIDSI